ncbi:unnamed protein product [Moneuplotes crassus]|uniref:DUF393 domain-containing protein n=1 Tax=Euplotes crassus TaxID=5936 RepID=A0AAD1Y3K3_EUPCR|nr:unnamed protein product [Moneuplotes crassus]
MWRRKIFVLYDGECNLCYKAVRFLQPRLRQEPLKVYNFIPSQKVIAKMNNEEEVFVDEELVNFLEESNQEIDLSTIYTIDLNDNTVMVRSNAVLKILSATVSPWRYLVVGKILPTCLRDCGYRFIARIRYKLFGRRCGRCIM